MANRSHQARLGRPVGRSGDLTRQNLLQAASLCFADAGLQGATLGGIARAANLSGPAVYNYYRSKDALFSAAVCAMYAEIEREYIAAFESQATFVAQISALLDTLKRMYREDAYWQNLVRAGSDAYAREPRKFKAIGQAQARIASVFRTAAAEAAERGEIDTALAPELVGDLVQSLLNAGLGAFSNQGLATADFHTAVDFLQSLLKGDMPNAVAPASRG